MALAQARWVADSITAQFPSETVPITTISTSGDRFTGHFPLQSAGKGLFVKEIEEALLREEIDVAVHSMKDLPTELPERLAVRVIPRREDARDVLVAREHGMTLGNLPGGARVGTGSPRRSAQLKQFRPDLEIVPLLGNVDTRLRKLHEDKLDAIVLAYAGLRRLGLEQHVCEVISPEVITPAVGQGALGLELRVEDGTTYATTRFLHDPETAACVHAERALLRGLGGGCMVPIAAHATIQGKTLRLQACIADTDGRRCIRGIRTGCMEEPDAVGVALAQDLLDQGACGLLV